MAARTGELGRGCRDESEGGSLLEGPALEWAGADGPFASAYDARSSNLAGLKFVPSAVALSPRQPRTAMETYAVARDVRLAGNAKRDSIDSRDS